MQILRSKCTYVQVFSDGMCWAMGDHENSIGFADHPMSNFYQPGLPVVHSRSHGSHTESSVVWVVQLPVRGRRFHLFLYAPGGVFRMFIRITEWYKICTVLTRDCSVSLYSHVSFHHFAGVLGSILKVLQVSLHLA